MVLILNIFGIFTIKGKNMQILFLLMGAILVLFMHAGFAFLEAGTVRKKNQVHSLVKILVDFGVGGVVYIFYCYFVIYYIT